MTTYYKILKTYFLLFFNFLGFSFSFSCFQVSLRLGFSDPVAQPCCHFTAHWASTNGSGCELVCRAEGQARRLSEACDKSERGAFPLEINHKDTSLQHPCSLVLPHAIELEPRNVSFLIHIYTNKIWALMSNNCLNQTSSKTKDSTNILEFERANR